MLSRKLIFMLCIFGLAGIAPCMAQENPVEAAKAAYEKGDYKKAVAVLQGAAAKEPNNGDIQLWLAKSYLGSEQIDEAVKSAEKAVAIDPKSSV